MFALAGPVLTAQALDQAREYQIYRESDSEMGRCKSINHFIPWAESVQVCGRERTHPFREEMPYFGFVGASRDV